MAQRTPRSAWTWRDGSPAAPLGETGTQVSRDDPGGAHQRPQALGGQEGSRSASAVGRGRPPRRGIRRRPWIRAGYPARRRDGQHARTGHRSSAANWRSRANRSGAPVCACGFPCHRECSNDRAKDRDEGDPRHARRGPSRLQRPHGGILLNGQSDIKVVAQAGSLAEARKHARSAPRFDVAVLDLSLPDGNGVDLIADLRQANPRRGRADPERQPRPRESSRRPPNWALDEIMDKLSLLG